MKFLFDMFPILLFSWLYYATGNNIFIATSVTIGATTARSAGHGSGHRKGGYDAVGQLCTGHGVWWRNAVAAQQDVHHVEADRALLGVCADLAGGASGRWQNLMRSLMEQQVQLPDPVWDKLLFAWIGFFLFMGGLNLAVAFNFSRSHLGQIQVLAASA